MSYYPDGMGSEHWAYLRGGECGGCDDEYCECHEGVPMSEKHYRELEQEKFASEWRRISHKARARAIELIEDGEAPYICLCPAPSRLVALDKDYKPTGGSIARVWGHQCEKCGDIRPLVRVATLYRCYYEEVETW